MCRLFGLRANQPVDVEFSLATGPKTVQKLGEEHPNGWGIGWYEGSSPVVTKEPISAAESKELRRAAAHVHSRIVIAHVRKATCGEVSEVNCHPFRYNDWLFAHNGWVKDRESLLSKLDVTHRAAIRGETDSEVYFHWVIQNVEKTGTVLEGLRSALQEVTNYTGLNFILADGTNLYAYRNASRSPNYYSLFFLTRDPEGSGFEELHSHEVQALIQSKRLRGEKAVLVCSEQLTNESWQEIPFGGLLVVGDDLSTRIESVR
jgi:predicted glutamine amidotransferase